MGRRPRVTLGPCSPSGCDSRGPLIAPGPTSPRSSVSRHCCPWRGSPLCALHASSLRPGRCLPVTRGLIQLLGPEPQGEDPLAVVDPAVPPHLLASGLLSVSARGVGAGAAQVPCSPAAKWMAGHWRGVAPRPPPALKSANRWVPGPRPFSCRTAACYFKCPGGGARVFKALLAFFSAASAAHRQTAPWCPVHPGPGVVGSRLSWECVSLGVARFGLRRPRASTHCASPGARLRRLRWDPIRCPLSEVLCVGPQARGISTSGAARPLGWCRILTAFRLLGTPDFGPLRSGSTAAPFKSRVGRKTGSVWQWVRADGGGARALSECDRHLDALGHAPTRHVF
ncbi:hypothetical protein NDU88_007195 [Pleurodeles waltl]|uniref:Uncharacterized protein n=1 Tax=Pleurodeles waltl TaxID=8319 RepID=A0AAV7SRS7_PLEWA|nr:hypothetical protein NDU88_007195 [Pleurodeles waltl]